MNEENFPIIVGKAVRVLPFEGHKKVLIKVHSINGTEVKAGTKCHIVTDNDIKPDDIVRFRFEYALKPEQLQERTDVTTVTISGKVNDTKVIPETLFCCAAIVVNIIDEIEEYLNLIIPINSSLKPGDIIEYRAVIPKAIIIEASITSIFPINDNHDRIGLNIYEIDGIKLNDVEFYTFLIHKRDDISVGDTCSFKIELCNPLDPQAFICRIHDIIPLKDSGLCTLILDIIINEGNAETPCTVILPMDKDFQQGYQTSFKVSLMTHIIGTITEVAPCGYNSSYLTIDVFLVNNKSPRNTLELKLAIPADDAEVGLVIEARVIFDKPGGELQEVVDYNCVPNFIQKPKTWRNRICEALCLLWKNWRSRKD